MSNTVGVVCITHRIARKRYFLRLPNFLHFVFSIILRWCFGNFFFTDVAPSKAWLRGDSILMFYSAFVDLRDLHHKEKVQTFLSEQTKSLFWTVWHLPLKNHAQNEGKRLFMLMVSEILHYDQLRKSTYYIGTSL